MNEGVIMMSRRELDRLEVIELVSQRRLAQAEASRRLGIGVRQVKRLLRSYRQHGAGGLVSGHRGRPSNRRISMQRRRRVLDLVREWYADFGPTLAAEKLSEVHGEPVSKETLRQWMTAEGIWQARRRPEASIHPSRPRRRARGELVQIDGSPHAWFEDRGSRCTLILFVDDATSQIVGGGFYALETTQAYLSVLRSYLARHGRPVALYSDRHSIFRVNRSGREEELTQFSRALKTLDIEPLHAHSPQAKGRVERAFQTCQDRWVKELRLRGVSDRASANACLEELIADYNGRFGRAAADSRDAHRAVLHDGRELDLILCEHHGRKLSKNLSLRFRGQTYQVRGPGQGRRLQGAHVTVCATSSSLVGVLHAGRELPVEVVREEVPPISVEDDKTVRDRVDRVRRHQQMRAGWKPPPDHPWRRPYGSAMRTSGRS